MKRNFPLSIILFLSALNLCTAHNGSINGQVTENATGLELPGAVVKLDPGALVTTSNDLGFFKFDNLPAGDYTLTVHYIGYETKTMTSVHVHDSESTTERIDLTPEPVDLRTVEISNTSVEHSLQTISALDIQTRPINSSQDVLRMVPGLFLAQHAGGGKAEQLFLRGFDIDHGTDINLSVDGIPVNMVSHAHGQGYADLHFVIPELIGSVDFKKGPYYADAGNFTTAGLVRFKTLDALDQNMFKIEGGQFNTARVFGAFNLLGENAERHNRHAYIASETLYSDGYFDSPQRFKRLNILGKFSALLDDNQRVSFTISAFQSSWNASGQVPERAIKSGLIDRFGSINNTEGGITSRYNFNFEHTKSLKNNGLVRNQLFYTDYAFELYSDFTFFLHDPVNGDQIRQKEHRRIFGYNGALEQEFKLLGRPLHSEIGLFYRNDHVAQDELSRVRDRSITTAHLALGDVDETNTGAYISETWKLGNGFSINAGLRADVFQFGYENSLDSLYAPKQVTNTIASPKLNFYYDPNPTLRFYLTSGYGFHSNDSRVVVPQGGRQTLPKAKGADLGTIFKPNPSLLLNVAAWYLGLDQEFVYVGDEGVVEPGGKTQRFGVDLSARLQLLRHLFVDADLTYSHARATEEPEGAQYIPLAPKYTGTGGICWDKGKGLFGSLRFRYLGDRAANEDNTLIAKGYFLLDAVAGWKKNNVEVSFSVQNLSNVAWKEAQFDTESRLKNELEPVSEIHFTPGTPFFLKGGILLKF
ncbi:MAG: TonB-dependent receptor [Bacteroidota bacterium]